MNLLQIKIILYIVICLSLLYFVIKTLKKNINSTNDTLTRIITENSDTVFLIINLENKEAIYISNNAEEILGLSNKDNDIVSKIFKVRRIKEELDGWDKSSSYVSQMIRYDSPKYNHDMWIRIKLFPYFENNIKYCVIQIQDATKEHDSQHTLITQASNIKSRESKLDQITSKIYDIEMNINLSLNSFELKYLNTDKRYFGEERRGKYIDELKKILKYINEQDKDIVASILNPDNLLEHFDKYELDSINLRYKLGSDIKNSVWLESTIFFLSKKEQTISILTKNVTEDASEVRKQNVILQNALNDAKMADRSKVELISTISHEIRTPLSNIIGISESLLNTKLDSNLKEDIENISESSNEVLHLIDSLLDPNKIEKKVLKNDETNYNLLKLFSDVLEVSKEYIENKPIKVNLNLDSNLPVIVCGNKIQIKQALIRIINNSIKYTDEGNIDISVKGKKKDNIVKLSIEIKDTGNGMSEAEINNVIKNNGSNSLSYVKKIIELLGGTFEIESKEGEYTKVTLTFDQKIIEDNKVGEMIANNKKAEEFDLSGKKILLVDDNELNLKVTNRLLSNYNLDITNLKSGEECLNTIKEGSKFDLILLDQMMPGLSGTETLKQLKDIKGFKTNVIVLTADAMEGKKEKYLSEGFDDYISKPIDKKELSRILKKFLK